MEKRITITVRGEKAIIAYLERHLAEYVNSLGLEVV